MYTKQALYHLNHSTTKSRRTVNFNGYNCGYSNIRKSIKAIYIFTGPLSICLPTMIYSIRAGSLENHWEVTAVIDLVRLLRCFILGCTLEAFFKERLSEVIFIFSWKHENYILICKNVKDINYLKHWIHSYLKNNSNL